jgi:signal transduction histidine kinase
MVEWENTHFHIGDFRMNNRTIYIADDDKNLLELYSSIFQSDVDELDFFEDEADDEFEVEMFEDGFYLVEAFQNRYANGERVPVAILDMRMPKMSGFETAKKIKDIDKNTIIVIITAYSDVSMSEIRQQLKNGIYYFKKPFNEEELYSLIDSVLKQWNDREENIQLQENLEKKIEEELEKSREKDAVIIRQQRLAYIGELLSSIAHHWRQPLNQLALTIQDLEDAYDTDDLDEEYFKTGTKEAIDIVSYMSKTIDNFRDFFAPHETETVFPIVQAIHESLDIYEYQIRNQKIELILDVNSSLLIKGFPNEFSRTLVSILGNAKEAIERNKVENPKIEIRTESSERKVFLYIEDNGGGVDENMIDKVFDPYSTIKPQSEGTGLGLFFCKMVIENQMNGDIKLSNFQDGVKVAVELLRVSN